MKNKTNKQTVDFVTSTNQLLASRGIDFKLTDNIDDIVPLVNLYLTCQEPIKMIGTSDMVKSVMENFARAKFGVQMDNSNAQEMVDETRDSLSNSFYDMQLVVMLIVKTGEYVKGIWEHQGQLKTKK